MLSATGADSSGAVAIDFTLPRFFTVSPASLDSFVFAKQDSLVRFQIIFSIDFLMDIFGLGLLIWGLIDGFIGTETIFLPRTACL